MTTVSILKLCMQKPVGTLLKWRPVETAMGYRSFPQDDIQQKQHSPAFGDAQFAPFLGSRSLHMLISTV